MAKELCYGKLSPIWIDAGRWKDLSRGWELNPRDRPTGVKRMRLTCPECGRKILSSVELINDGDFLVHTLPPHKPKAWWKKHKKRKEKSSKIR